jgi:hypothetical protein
MAVNNSRYIKWKERYGLEHIRRLAESGLSDEEIGLSSGLGLSIFRRWKKKYPDFAAAIELGRSGADYAVVEALYKKAVGYNVTLSKTYKLKRVEYDAATGKKIREYEELATGIDENYVPGDLKAETFWLKNRQPERWSEKPLYPLSEMEGSAGGVIEIPEADLIDEPDADDDIDSDGGAGNFIGGRTESIGGGSEDE